MSEISHVATHEGDAIARLIEQYKGKPRLEAFIRAFVKQVQEIEDALYLTFWESAIDNAFGAQVDVLGRIVGQQRQDMSDPEYRTFIRARIKANGSDGKAQQLIEIMELILDGQDTPSTHPVFYYEFYPATVLIEAFELTSNGYVIWKDFLEMAAAGGVRLFFQFSDTYDDALLAEDEAGGFIPTDAQSCSDSQGGFDGGTTSCTFG